VKLFGSETLVEVVGIVRDTLYHDLAGEPTPFVFFAYRQIFHQNTVLHIRTAGGPAPMFATLQKELQALDPALPLIGMRTMEGGLENLLWGPRTGARLMSVFGALGLLLAALGVYAIMAHSVTQRTREIGIRIAVGAQTHDVLTLILRRGLVVTVVGLFAGLILACALARHYQKFFTHVHHLDPLTYGAIALLLSLAALLACWLPARRAARVNPIAALRAE
jgi:putative ABC transport system permease protein